MRCSPIEEETDEAFPQDPAVQLAEVLRSMARAWEGTTARLLRQAKGAPTDAGLGLVVQHMALGVGQPESGAGVIQFVDATTGQPQITGRYRSQSQGRDALADRESAIYLTRDPRGPSLEELCPKCFDDLKAHGALCRRALREEMQIEFTIENGNLSVLDAVRVQRSQPRRGADRRDPGRTTASSRARGGAAHRPPRAERTAAPADRPRQPARRHRARHRRQPRRRHRAHRLHLRRRAGQRRAGRGLHPGAPRNHARGYPRHACRQGRADRTRRHDQPRRRDRARPWPALRRRRQRRAA